MTQGNATDPRAVFSRLVGGSVVAARLRVARLLIWFGVKPNTLTVLGLVVTLAGAVLLVYGAGDRPGSSLRGGHSWLGVAAALVLILASAFDILDGAVARLKGQITERGACLDSCVDRLSDGAIFLGIMLYYVRHPEVDGWRLFAAAAVVALVNAELISYVKARAENFIPSCPVGYWQRGERIAGVLIGLCCGHIATVLLMLAVLSGLTVLRRITFAYRQIKRQELGRPLLEPYRLEGIMRLALWRYRRRTVPYDLVTATNIAVILFVDAESWFR